MSEPVDIVLALERLVREYEADARERRAAIRDLDASNPVHARELAHAVTAECSAADLRKLIRGELERRAKP